MGKNEKRMKQVYMYNSDQLKVHVMISVQNYMLNCFGSTLCSINTISINIIVAHDTDQESWHKANTKHTKY